MFEQSFVQGTGELRKPWTVAASTVIQIMAVAAVLAVPLFRTPRITWNAPSIFFVPPLMAQPPVAVQARASNQAVPLTGRAVFQPRFTAPAHIPNQTATTFEPPAARLGDPAPPGVQGLSFGDAIGTLKLPPFPEPVAPAKSNPPALRVGGGVQQALLINGPKPSYPALARAARISGVVRLTAIIARDGSIRNLQLIGGPPLLVNAAIEAVRQWHYKPTLLNGEPVEVITEIDVNFTLSN